MIPPLIKFQHKTFFIFSRKSAKEAKDFFPSEGGGFAVFAALREAKGTFI
jgi:hypothetical protein